ncbi:helix-turn-helix domain-containing protein [Sanyastnella coralliicola]|uniref:helix-turn-helix domain-containing protein n=1 Tax=Sanyastnella coralliicola TaxID=3069118 RepID=UPI0027B9852E|nr:AraC family transcriptional regulator [Longitalea sp. SCSIO 12813]
MVDSKVIEFKGMPLFQKARFRTPFIMQGDIKDFACFFYMVQGSLISYDRRGVHKISDKDAILKNCGSYIQEYVSSSSNEECEAIAVYLYPDLLKEIYKNEVPSFLKDDGIPVPKKLIANELVEQYMTNLAIYFENPASLDEELGILKIKELMLILLKSESHQDVRKLLSEIFAPVNVAFKEAIHRNLYNNLSVDQLAFICNMSVSSFKREFKKVFEDTPARYIKNKRLARAASELLCKNDPVSAIAYDCGFQDITTFSASFSDKYGMSPSKYRMAQIGK